MVQPRTDEPASDAALVAAVRGGDRQAFSMLLQRHRPLLVALCRRALGDAGWAEDAAQEAALQALLGLDGLRRADRFGPWLAGIGLNVCRRWLRDRSRTAWSLDALAGGRHDEAFTAFDRLDEHLSPAEQAEEADVAARVRRAVDGLPAGQRRAALLFYLAGLTYAETAALLDIQVGALKTRLHKARASLRRELWTLWKEETMGTDRSSTPPAEQARPIEVRVESIRLNPANDRRIVLLREVDGGRLVPIWIGHFEADAIAIIHQQVPVARPLTFRFAARLLEAAGGQLRAVYVNRLAEETFYAEAVVAGPGGSERRVDARPSDAIGLALEVGVPIFVAPDVMDRVGLAELPVTSPDGSPVETVELRIDPERLKTGAWPATRPEGERPPPGG